jgi:hypothetical protein
MSLPVKPSSYFILISLGLLLGACHSGEILSPVMSMTISNPIKTQWLGFGFNEDPLDRNKEDHDVGDWGKGRWELTNECVNYIRPSLVRIKLYICNDNSLPKAENCIIIKLSILLSIKKVCS